MEVLDKSLLMKESIFRLLNPLEQVKNIWGIDCIPWGDLLKEAKILFIFRMAKENQHVDFS